MRTNPLANLEPLIRRVYRYASYRLGDSPDAEDVTSDVFERALRYGDTYDAGRGDPGAWLIGIARRCVDDVLRERGAAVELAQDPPGSEGPELAVPDRLDLRSAIETLGPRDREIIGLRYGADLTARQIAELLGEKTNAIEVALHRALTRLRAVLADEPAAARRRRATGVASNPTA
jgi:RNA polymerase sigma-70 factor (ECF subfamily)